MIAISFTFLLFLVDQNQKPLYMPLYTAANFCFRAADKVHYIL